MEASTTQIHRHYHNFLTFKNLSHLSLFNSKSLCCARSKTLPRLSISMQYQRSEMGAPTSESKTSLSYKNDLQSQHSEGVMDSLPTENQVNGDLNTDESVSASSVPQKKGAKIHDFCFGIPYGGLILSAGLVGFIFSRNPAGLMNVLYGGALLALSSMSLKIWKQGKSSLPYILGQAALSAVLLSKHVQAYSLTKKVFPSGFYLVVSAAMLCFYTYVMASGGNPPPKKLATNSPGQ